jgi:hypothetical protein
MLRVGGTAFVQTLLILIMLVLSRHYTPPDFDILAVYTVLLGLILAAASLRYNIAIPIPCDDRDGASFLSGALLGNTVMSLSMDAHLSIGEQGRVVSALAGAVAA